MPGMNRFMVSVAILTMVGVTHAFAAPGTPKLELSAGMGFPANPDAFTDGWNPGFSGAIGLGVEVTPVVSIIGGFDFSYFGFDDEALTGSPLGVTLDGGGASVIYVSAGAKIVPTASTPGPADFFLLAGLGYYNVSIGEITASLGGLSFTIPGPDESALGLHVGAGVEFTPFLLQAMYLTGFTEGDATGHFSLSAGVSLRLGGASP